MVIESRIIFFFSSGVSAGFTFTLPFLAIRNRYEPVSIIIHSAWLLLCIMSLAECSQGPLIPISTRNLFIHRYPYQPNLFLSFSWRLKSNSPVICNPHWMKQDLYASVSRLTSFAVINWRHCLFTSGVSESRCATWPCSISISWALLSSDLPHASMVFFLRLIIGASCRDGPRSPNLYGISPVADCWTRCLLTKSAILFSIPVGSAPTQASSFLQFEPTATYNLLLSWRNCSSLSGRFPSFSSSSWKPAASCLCIGKLA